MNKVRKLILKFLSPQYLNLKSYFDDTEELENFKENIEWYGHFLAGIKIIIDNNLPAPAACTVDKEKLHPIIFINENQFYKYNLMEQIAILKHEVLHLLNEHFNRKEDENSWLWNIATDLAINQLIPFIPKNALILEEFNKEFNMKLEPEKPAEYYYKELKKTAEKYGINIELLKNKILDNHSKWDNLSPAQKDVIRESIKKLIKETTEKSRGNMPKEIVEIFKIIKEKNKISWKKYLRKLLSNKKGNSVKTIKRRDKRFQKRLDLKGKKKYFTGDVLVIVDVSGSMDNKEIIKGINEVFYIIKKMNYKVHIIQVDTEPRYYKEGEFDIKKMKFKRMGTGGTYLFPGIKLADEMKIPYSAIIIITDGYIETPEEWEYIPNKKMFFLLTTETELPEFASLKNTKIFKI